MISSLYYKRRTTHMRLFLLSIPLALCSVSISFASILKYTDLSHNKARKYFESVQSSIAGDTRQTAESDSENLQPLRGATLIPLKTENQEDHNQTHNTHLPDAPISEEKTQEALEIRDFFQKISRKGPALTAEEAEGVVQYRLIRQAERGKKLQLQILSHLEEKIASLDNKVMLEMLKDI